MTHITHAVICLHGLGSSGSNMAPLAQELNLPGVRFIFPDAPKRPVTCNQGYIMPAWYDIEHFDFTTRPYLSDAAGIDNSCQRIRSLVADEQARYGIAPNNIFLMGFSQGGSIALELGLHDSNTFAGIIGLSTLPAKALKTFEQVAPHSRNIPIFLAHGTQDKILPHSLAEYMHDHLQQLNCPITWRSYTMGHEICAQELADLRTWFLARIAVHADAP